MNLESALGDVRAARIADPVGVVIKFDQGTRDLFGLEEQLLVCGHLGDALHSETRAVTYPFAKGDPAACIRWCGQISRPILEFPLLGKQHLAHVSRHISSVPESSGRRLSEVGSGLSHLRMTRGRRSQSAAWTSPGHRRNLIILRAGDSSLHEAWFDPVKPGSRTWDLAISYYGASPDRIGQSGDHFHHFPGSKWAGLVDFLENFGREIARYDFVWLPDDDLATSSRNIDEFFSVVRSAQLDVAQPALTRGSYRSHRITRRRVLCEYRLTDFVEIMAPCFSARSLPLYTPTFSENESGWGLEWLWLDIARRHGHRMGIVDRSPVRHTRPVGSAGHGLPGKAPADDARALLDRFDLERTTPQTLARVRRRVGHGGPAWHGTGR